MSESESGTIRQPAEAISSGMLTKRSCSAFQRVNLVIYSTLSQTRLELICVYS